MSDPGFDPFALPSSFDPLAVPLPPPPRRRRRAAGEAAPEQPTPPPTVEQRLQALKDEVAILKARLDDQMGRIVVRVAEMLAEEQQALLGAIVPSRRSRSQRSG